MLSPSFCQVMLGRGTPKASQGSITCSSARASTTLGNGFTTGEPAKEQGYRSPQGHQHPGLSNQGVSEHWREDFRKNRRFWKLWHKDTDGLIFSQRPMRE